MKPYQHILDRLEEEKESGLESVLAEEVESYFLDYKEIIEDFSNKTNLGDCWGTLAKAISGFGNGLGGILIFGIKDKPRSPSPFLGFKNFEKIVNEFVSKSTNPHHECVKTFSLVSSLDNSKGYVIVEIPQSMNRPLQVISNNFLHRYFYRSGESHVDIPHDVIAGMLGKKIPPKLIYLISTTKFSDITRPNPDLFSFDILIKNAGSTVIRDIWFNLSVDIPDVHVMTGNFSDKFAGSIFNNSTSLVSVDGYKLPPQGLTSPARLQMVKRKLEENKDYHLYFTFGCDGSKIYEFDSKFKGGEYNLVLEKDDVEELINFFQKYSDGHIIEK